MELDEILQDDDFEFPVEDEQSSLNTLTSFRNSQIKLSVIHPEILIFGLPKVQTKYKDNTNVQFGLVLLKSVYIGPQFMKDKLNSSFASDEAPKESESLTLKAMFIKLLKYFEPIFLNEQLQSLDKPFVSKEDPEFDSEAFKPNVQQLESFCNQSQTYEEV